VLSSEVLWSSREVVWRAGKSAPPREDGLVRRGVEEALGDWEGKFKIMIPLEEGKKAGRSTVSLREYRVVWKLEVGESLVLSSFRSFLFSLARFPCLRSRSLPLSPS